MPLNTQTIQFEDEIKSIEEDMDDLASRQASMPPDADGHEMLLNQGRQLNNQRNILQKLREGDVDGLPEMESITLAGLTEGEKNIVEDFIDDHESVRHETAWVAVATRQAPYLQHDPEDALNPNVIEDTVVAVGDLPIPFVDWVEAKSSELSYLSESRGNGYLELVRDKQQAGE